MAPSMEVTMVRCTKEGQGGRTSFLKKSSEKPLSVGVRDPI
jgi:hypothetical protein